MAISKHRHRVYIGFVGFVVLWFAVTRLGLIDSLFLPDPLAVLQSYGSLFGQARLANDLGVTIGRTLASIALAVIIGVPAGLYLGYNSALYSYVEGGVHAMRSVPATALFPLFLLIFGIGHTSVILLAMYPAFLIILVNTVSGVRLANKLRLHLAHQLELGPFRIVREVLFYESLPAILDGIRTSVSYALALIIAIEMFMGSNIGLGKKIYTYQSTYQIPETYAVIIMAALVGIILNKILTMLEHYLLRWMPNFVETANE